MKGAELSRAFYDACGAPMLEKDFSDLLPYLAVGLVGDGSECFGYDDEISQDHDFEPGFCIFLPDESVVDRKAAFRLERAYAALPKEFMGIRRAPISPVGGSRHGVLRTAEFYEARVAGAITPERLIATPDFYLASATNGAVYFDNYGEFSRWREALAEMPEDVRRKKLAASLLLMGQAGQYNFRRCLCHGETAAAQLAAGKFAENAVRAAHLLNRRWCPFYKWSFRSLRELPKLAQIADSLEYLLTTDNRGDIADTKSDIIEDICALMIDELRAQGLTENICNDMERHAYSVNDGIADPNLRNLHVLAAAE